MQNLDKKNKCPKCGFYMCDNYCIKCGFVDGIYIKDLKKYEENISDLELLMKSQFQKCIHNENLFLIYLVGPFYFSLNMHFLITIILVFFDCLFGIMIGIFFSKGILPVIVYFLFLRIIYVMFSNSFLVFLNKLKIEKIKKNNIHYQELLIKKRSYSIILPIAVILFYITVISLVVFIYKMAK